MKYRHVYVGSSFDSSNCLFPEYMLESEPVSNHTRTDYHRDVFRMSLLEGVTLTDRFGMPVIDPCTENAPSSLITFPEARCLYNKGQCTSSTIHFYVEDSAFWCVSSSVDTYLPVFLNSASVIGLDLSIQIDMPTPLKMYNSYLNKLLTRHLQIKGITTYPNIIWAEPNSYGYCFDGYPQCCTVAVNSMGIIGNPRSVYFWQKGYEEMIERLRPLHIIRYGDLIPGEVESISTYYPNNHLHRMRYGR